MIVRVSGSDGFVGGAREYLEPEPLEAVIFEQKRASREVGKADGS
jgi:hypothetical protein